MSMEPIKGRRVLSPPGHVAVKLPRELWPTYKRLHSQYQAYLSGIPMLAERDFDGKRSVKMTPKQLEALNAAVAPIEDEPEAAADSVFGAQARGRTRLFKRLQFLS